MGLVGRERAVLAVAAARPRERQREIAAERDTAAHALGPFYESTTWPHRAPILARADARSDACTGSLGLPLPGCPGRLDRRLRLERIVVVHAGVRGRDGGQCQRPGRAPETPQRHADPRF